MNSLTRQAASTAAVVMASLRESCAVASSTFEEMRRASVELNAIIQSFTPMEATRTATFTALMLMGSGLNIFSAELWMRPAPTTTMSTATAMAHRYSKRPCP